MARRDDEEFLRFAAGYGAQMRRTAYLLCGDWHRAADVTQEALIRLYVAWPRLDTDAGLRAYARRAVVSVLVDAARKRSSHERPRADLPDGVVEDPAGDVADRLLLMQALAELPPRQRACVVLRFYEDLSVEDVAAALGCRSGTVKSQTARGLTSLREAFRRCGGDLLLGQDESTEARTW
jgi:RNA polymerase sigma-70 factor (sigma-E family)